MRDTNIQSIAGIYLLLVSVTLVGGYCYSWPTAEEMRLLKATEAISHETDTSTGPCPSQKPSFIPLDQKSINRNEKFPESLR